MPDNRPFEEIARPYCMVDAVQHYTSGESDRAFELYAETVKIDGQMNDATSREACALITRDRQAYRQAREDARYWYDEGRDAVCELRALFNNAQARAQGHPRAAL